VAKTKYTTTKISVGQAEKLQGFFDETDKWLTKTSNEMRDELESGTRTSLENYMTFFGHPRLRPKLSDEVRQAVEHYEAGSRDDSVWVSTSLLRKEYNKFSAKMSKGRSLAHEDFSVIAGNLFICYNMLARLKAIDTKSGVPVRDTRSAGQRRRRPTTAQWDHLIETFRRLYITATAIAENPIQKGNDSLEVIRDSLNGYFDGLTQTQHELTKSKHVDILTGKVEQKIRYKVQSKGGKKAEKAIGIMATAIKQGGAKTDLEKGLEQNFTDIFNDYGDQFMSIQGSKRVDKEVLDQVFDVVKGKKTSPYRAKTQKTATTKAKFKNPIDNKLKKAAAKALAVKAIKKVPKSRRATGQKEERQQISEKDILKLKRIINRKLPAQVRRNMGRPALINRTGRFSNSVKLVNLRRGPKSLVGKYSYQYDPYATFENRGAKQWPTGYNPKPLITKSIRDVAIKHTEERFTLRRE
tara:strand:- start:508 stop:1908 length:1401 start_codon:yes stop_codon:yes gene_type:complete